ncbi:hypothetical protein ACC703_07805 [Rhizobium ruizarguesonis]|uniref:hypothetical protein n=1 Tax=Rhizobium leguminosarum TaxID=384 RepID=UPI00103267B5|nr:hypothetical protein [Rhizobium leguminosarum]TAV10668.1 hypothetical protein ELI37_09255 [Rhizobium leguminosarum]
MMTVTQIDPVLAEDGRNVAFYAWKDDDEAIFWSISLPMRIEEAAFDDMLPAWVELGWKMLTQHSG